MDCNAIVKDFNGVRTERRWGDCASFDLHHPWTWQQTWHHQSWNLSAGLLVLVLVFVCYFAPTLIALMRGVRRWGVVLLVNLLFGWSVIGWVAAFIMAFALERRWEHNLRLQSYQSGWHNQPPTPPG